MIFQLVLGSSDEIFRFIGVKVGVFLRLLSRWCRTCAGVFLTIHFLFFVFAWLLAETMVACTGLRRIKGKGLAAVGCAHI